MSKLLGILIVLCIGVYPFCIPVSILSLKYYAALYKISPESLKTFIANLWLPLKLFYSHFLGKMYWDYSQHPPEQVAASLTSQRILASAIPAMFVIAAIIGGIGIFVREHRLAWENALLLLIVSASIRLAWRFGNRLEHFQN
jgi:hypothetical protein